CEAGLDEPHERETARGAIELEAQPAGALRGTRGGRGGRDLDPAHVALEPAAYAKASIHGEPPALDLIAQPRALAVEHDDGRVSLMGEPQRVAPGRYRPRPARHAVHDETSGACLDLDGAITTLDPDVGVSGEPCMCDD